MLKDFGPNSRGFLKNSYLQRTSFVAGISNECYLMSLKYSQASLSWTRWDQGKTSRYPRILLIDWLIFHWHGDITIAGKGLQNLGLCSALRAFEQGGIFIVPHLLWHRTSVFPVSSEGPPHLYICLLWHTRVCGVSILTQILMDSEDSRHLG
jgi:hypothetical protein